MLQSSSDIRIAFRQRIERQCETHQGYTRTGLVLEGRARREATETRRVLPWRPIAKGMRSLPEKFPADTSRHTHRVAGGWSETGPAVLRVQNSLEQLRSSGNLEACEPIGQNGEQLPATAPLAPECYGCCDFFFIFRDESRTWLFWQNCAEPVLELFHRFSAIQFPESLPFDAPASRCRPQNAGVRQMGTNRCFNFIKIFLLL